MKVPEHIAIIMDGNGRWAKARGLSRYAGHKEGIKRVKETVRNAKELGVKVLTVFAFSTENWNRPRTEIEFLFSYLENFLRDYRDDLMDGDIRLQFIGRRDRFSRKVSKEIESVEALTGNNTSFLFTIALDYGGRWDITQAARLLAGAVKNGELAPEDITEDMLQKHLALGNVPVPDLLIRTSGEQRISNFLLWDLAYAEFYFPEVLWPDFDQEQLQKALETFTGRQRRFGAV